MLSLFIRPPEAFACGGLFSALIIRTAVAAIRTIVRIGRANCHGPSSLLFIGGEGAAAPAHPTLSRHALVPLRSEHHRKRITAACVIAFWAGPLLPLCLDCVLP